ncbi:MAG: hypothetical protein MJ139_01205 [Limosilactobacillus sp.]|nr:hypothetical protein [Limosilactobacillus sp.]
MQIAEADLAAWLDQEPKLAEFKVMVTRMRAQKAHIL